MKPKDLQEVIECLPTERTLFRYHGGMYASLILGYILGEGRKVRWLKNSPFARLLKQPAIAAAMRGAGGGEFTPDLLPWPTMDNQPKPFVLTVGKWTGSHCGCCNQMSRQGHNLVLQVNLPGCHDAKMRELFGYADMKTYNGHPINRAKSTLAWARLDIDFHTGEVLIEEVQTDWVRDAERLADPELWTDEQRMQKGWPTAEAAQQYLTEVFEPYRKIWAEATLAATIWFIREELGIDKIYYHSWRSGVEYKLVKGHPPRYLYEDLPKQFGFSKTKRPPTLIMSYKRNQRLASGSNAPYWYKLELDAAA